MVSEWRLVLLSIASLLIITKSLILKDPGYSPDYFYSSAEQKVDFRRTFLDKRRQNIVTAKRVELLDKYLSNDSVFVDGIIHNKIDKDHKQWQLVNKFETEYRNLIGMNGVNYYFKRDPYWRTWRKVKFPDGDRMICYRCESSRNCSDCQNAGYWAIEENLPCPYEIVSVKDNVDVCAINFKNNTNIEEPCPTITQFTDIMSKCDNPIDTQWRIMKSYKKEVSERYPAIFCGGRDYCDISTFYTITPQYVSFRIVNSTNHIIYSKIMKNNDTNYACANECGYLDPNTRTVSKTGQPFIVDLINKNKREDKTEGSTVFEKTTLRSTQDVQFKKNKLKQNINEMETAFNLPVKRARKTADDNDSDHHHHHDKKHPTCSSMKRRMEEEMSDELNDFVFNASLYPL